MKKKEERQGRELKTEEKKEREQSKKRWKKCRNRGRIFTLNAAA